MNKKMKTNDTINNNNNKIIIMKTVKIITIITFLVLEEG